MKIMVLGATGVVGYHLAKGLAPGNEITRVARNSASVDIRADASDAKILEGIIRKARPDAIINAIKPPLSVDDMERERELAYRINVGIPESLAKLQKKHGYFLVQVSTDGVYEGVEGEEYTEESPVRPTNYYALTKALAEEKIAENAERYLILRTEGVFGFDERQSNFFMRLKKAAAEGKEFAAASDQCSQPIYGAELARAVSALLGKGSEGIYNAVSPDYLSRYGLAQKMAAKMGWSCKLRKVSCLERGVKIQPFLKVSIKKIEREIGRIKGIDAQLDDLKREESG